MLNSAFFGKLILVLFFILLLQFLFIVYFFFETVENFLCVLLRRVDFIDEIMHFFVSVSLHHDCWSLKSENCGQENESYNWSQKRETKDNAPRQSIIISNLDINRERSHYSDQITAKHSKSQNTLINSTCSATNFNRRKILDVDRNDSSVSS